MNQEDAVDFIRAIVKEVEDDHEFRNHWTMVPGSETNGKKTILSIWSFKRKRSPSGELLKHKARLWSMAECKNGEIPTGKLTPRQ